MSAPDPRAATQSEIMAALGNRFVQVRHPSSGTAITPQSLPLTSKGALDVQAHLERAGYRITKENPDGEEKAQRDAR